MPANDGCGNVGFGDDRPRRRRRIRHRDDQRLLIGRVVVQPVAAAQRRRPVAEDVPREAAARRHVLVGRILVELTRRRRAIGQHVGQRRVAPVDILRHRRELVADAAIQRDARRDAPLVLQIRAEQREAPVAIELRFRREAQETRRPAFDERAQAGERVDAVGERRVHHVVLIVLGQQARLQQMRAARVRQRIFAAEDVLHEPQRTGRLRPEASLEAADVDAAGFVAAGNERRERSGSIRFDVLSDARAAEADAHVVQRVRRERLPVFTGEELVLRQERAWKLRIVGRQELIRVVERVAREELLAVREVVIDAALQIVLIGRLTEREADRPRARRRAPARSRADIRSDTAPLPD